MKLKIISLINLLGEPTSYDVQVPEDILIIQLKKEIFEITEVPPSSQFLKYQSEISFIPLIEDSAPLSIYNIPNDSFIYVELLARVREHSLSSPLKEYQNMKQKDEESSSIGHLLDLTIKGDLKTIKTMMNTDNLLENYTSGAISSYLEVKNVVCNDLGKNGWNAIHVAIINEMEEIVLFFIEKRGDFNIPTSTGWTPLMLAITQNNFEILKLILTLTNSNINQCTSRGTALHIACQRKQKDMIKLLINAKANIYTKDMNNQTVMDLEADEEIRNLLENKIQISPLSLMKQKSNIQKTVLVCGFMFKIRNLIVSGMNLRYFVLDPFNGTLIRYKFLKDYPNRPKEILYLKDIECLQRIKPTWYMRKDLQYFEIVYHSKQILGCQNLSTLKLWMNYINQYAITANEKVQQQEETKTDMDLFYGDENNEKIDKMEIQDIKREEDNGTIFFRKNKLIPKKGGNGDERSTKSFSKSTTQIQIDRENELTNSTLEVLSTSFISKFQDEKVKFESFDLIKLLGCGSFGKVFLVRKKDDGKIFAMKALKKRELILRKKLRYAITETKILKSCNHPFILQIHYSFQTPKYFYLVIDFCPRGDLSNELLKVNTFSEEIARFYIAELVLAIEYLHKKNIIYRDLKPENILIDIQGHIKLADFGLSKDGIGDDDRTKSFCGSPAYLSPEVLLNKGKAQVGYGKTTDLYGIGAVLYELLIGHPPFFTPEIGEMFRRIREGKVEFSKNVSQHAKDLIKKLLEREPSNRIGASSKEELKKHPFFKNIDWNKLYRKECDPPFDEIEISDDILKVDKNLKFEDEDYEEKTFTHNRVPGFSFAKAGLEGE